MSRDIDERVVSMAFENQKFEAGVAQTLKTLNKLQESLKLTGATTGLSGLEAAANKINLSQPGLAADKLKGKFDFTQPIKALGDVEKAADKINMSGAAKAADGLRGKFSKVFADLKTFAGRIDLTPLRNAFERARGWMDFGRAPQQAMQNIETASNNVHLGGIQNAIQESSRGFSLLQGAAAVALGGIAAIAAQQGALIAKALTLGPVIDGFREYETNLTSIQTILANTQADGTELRDVTKALDELNTYSDKTIYNFGEMARNIGTFTAAGVDLKTATSSIKGIANLAALSGSNSQQASTAMYQLSQAIAAGKVNLMDWNSVVNAGMGGEVFQKALWDTAKVMGTIKNIPMGQTFEEWKKKGNTFRQSLSQVQKDAASGLTGLRKAQEEGAESIQHAQESAAEATEQAARRIKDAQKGVSLANKQAETDIQDAVAAQHAAVKQSAEDVKNALDGVRDARKRLAEAMKPPSQNELEAASDNLRTAQLDNADLAGAVSEAQQEQTRSAQDLADAQKRLSDLQRSGASASDILSAQRAVEDAQKRATDASDAQERALLRQRAAARGVTEAEQALAETQKKGTDQDQNVKEARDALTQATTAYRDAQVNAAKDVEAAEQHTADVRIKSVAAQKAAGQQLADAEKQQAKTIRDSRESVASATEAAAERIQSAKLAMAEKGPDMTWLTSDVLTSTLKQFTGDMSDAQLAAMGFNKEQIKAIQAQAKTAQHAAQDVKTLTALISTTKEQLGTGFSNTFKTLFGDFETAPEMFTSLSKSIGNFVGAQSDARNQMLKEWAALGGRDLLGQGLKNAFDGLLSVLKPIKEAFRDIFPKKTTEDLVEITAKFAAFTEKLKIGPDTAENLRRTFAGLFAILSIGKSILGGVFTALKEVVAVFAGGSGGVLEFTGSIGDFLVSLDKAIKKSQGFHDFFVGLGKVLAVPFKLLRDIAQFIGALFSGYDESKADNAGKSLDGLGKALTPLQKILKGVSEGFKQVTDFLSFIGGKIGPALADAFKPLTEVVNQIGEAFKNADYEKVFNILETGLIAGIFLVIRKAFKGGLKFDISKLGGGILENIRNTMGTLQGTLVSMQNSIKAATLMLIATAVVELAAGVKILSSIDGDKLAQSMTAVAVGLGELVGAMSLLVNGTGKLALIQMPVIAASLVVLSGAVIVLAGALKIMATMSWDEIARGLAGVAGALVAVGAGVRLIPPNIALVGPALIPMAIALNGIALALKIMSTMKWEEIAKGLAGVAGGLTAISIGMALMPTVRLVAAGAGIVIISAGLILLAGALKAMGSMDLETLGKGIGAIGAALVVIGLAVGTIPPTLALQAAGLVILAGALNGIAVAVALMGGMDFSTLAKGIGAIGAELIVLSIGLIAMQGSIGGAAALVLVAAGLNALIPVIGIMGAMKLTTIAKGLGAIAATMIVIGAAGAIAAPGFASIATAFAVLGVGIVAVGGGIYLLAKGMSLLSKEGQDGITALLLALTAFVAVLPKIIVDFLKGMVEVVKGVADIAPEVTAAVAVIIEQIINLFIQESPNLALAVGSFIDAILLVIGEKAIPIMEAGWQLLLGLLTGITNHMPDALAKGAEIVVQFLTGLASKLPDIIAAGVDVIVAYIQGITDEYPRLIEEMGTMVATIILAIANELPKIVTAGATLISKFILGIANNLKKVFDAGGTLIVKIIEGISAQNKKVTRAAAKMIGDFLETAAQEMVNLTDRIAKIITNFLNGMAKAIRDNDDEMRAAGWNVASAIIDGLWEGLNELKDKVIKKVEDIITALPKKALSILDSHSPSKVFHQIGSDTMLGLANGITASGPLAVRSVVSTGTGMKDAMKDTMSDIPNQLGDEMDMNPVITPVLDFSKIKEQMASGENPMGYMINDARLSGPLTTRGYGYATRTAEEMAAFEAARKASQQAQYDRDSAANLIGRPVMFRQTNISPKALSAPEIYRNTKNQLSQAKDAFGVTGGTLYRE